MQKNKNSKGTSEQLKDYGNMPLVFNIEDVTLQNTNFRTTLWTGKYMQLTLMDIPSGESIGLEVHKKGDQFIRIESGKGLVQMGNNKKKLEFQQEVYDDFAIVIPAKTWHNITNIGDSPLKLYVLYAPPEHPYGTTHETKKDSIEHE